MDYLFEYDSHGSRCKCSLELLNGRDAKAVLDSGASLSAMSVQTYCRLTGADKKFVLNFLNEKGTPTSVSSYDSNPAQACYCYVRNCVIADREFGKFHFVLTLGNSDDILLGMNFIQSFDTIEYVNPRITNNGLVVKDIGLSGFNRDTYEKYFAVWRRGSDEIELNLLSRHVKTSKDGGLNNPLSIF